MPAEKVGVLILRGRWIGRVSRESRGRKHKESGGGPLLDACQRGAIGRDGESCVAVGIFGDGMELSVDRGDEADLQALRRRTEAVLIRSDKSIQAVQSGHGKEVKVAKSGERTGFSGRNLYGLNRAESITDPVNSRQDLLAVAGPGKSIGGLQAVPRTRTFSLVPSLLEVRIRSFPTSGSFSRAKAR